MNRQARSVRRPVEVIGRPLVDEAGGASRDIDQTHRHAGAVGGVPEIGHMVARGAPRVEEGNRTAVDSSLSLGVAHRNDGRARRGVDLCPHRQTTIRRPGRLRDAAIGIRGCQFHGFTVGRDGVDGVVVGHDEQRRERRR